MVGQPSHVKQLSLSHVCKIGLIYLAGWEIVCNVHRDHVAEGNYALLTLKRIDTVIDRGGRKVRLIDLTIPIRSSDFIGRYMSSQVPIFVLADCVGSF